MNINNNNPIKSVSGSIVHSENGALPFAEGTRLNVRILKMMNNRTTVRLKQPQPPNKSIIVCVAQNLSPNKVWTAIVRGGKPVFSESILQNVKHSVNVGFTDTLLGNTENAESSNSLLNVVGSLFGVKDSKLICEEKRRNCLSFSDEHGHYYFIFRLPTDESFVKYVVRIDPRLNVLINIYSETENPTFVTHLTDKMNHIRTSLGSHISSLNFTVFTQWLPFREECEKQLGLSNIDVVG